MNEPRLRLEGTERGQTLPDFTVGIAIFLLTISFIVVLVPQLTVPFEDQEQPAVAERITSDLSENLLAEQEAPSRLNESRTLSFFEDELEADQLGIDPRYSVNITLRDPSDSAILCENGSGESITDCDGGSKLAVGPSVPPDGRSVSTAKVGVFTEETNAVLEVRVW